MAIKCSRSRKDKENQMMRDIESLKKESAELKNVLCNLNESEKEFLLKMKKTAYLVVSVKDKIADRLLSCGYIRNASKEFRDEVVNNWRYMAERIHGINTIDIGKKNIYILTEEGYRLTKDAMQ